MQMDLFVGTNNNLTVAYSHQPALETMHDRITTVLPHPKGWG